MSKGRHSEAQMIATVKQLEAGSKAEDAEPSAGPALLLSSTTPVSLPPSADEKPTVLLCRDKKLSPLRRHLLGKALDNHYPDTRIFCAQL